MTSDESVRERGLWQAVLAGDEGAWRALYEASFEPLYGYVLWRCAGLRDSTDDIVQETWLVAVRRLRWFDPERGSFLTWLRGIAGNLVRNHFRKEKRRPVVPLGNIEVPVRAESSRDEAEAIAGALAALPEHYEMVLRAKYLEQNSVADIAAERGESVKAVESLLTRARQALREALGTCVV